MKCYPYEGGVEELSQSSLTQRVIQSMTRKRTKERSGDVDKSNLATTSLPLPYDRLDCTCYCPGGTLYEEYLNKWEGKN